MVSIGYQFSIFTFLSHFPIHGTLWFYLSSHNPARPWIIRPFNDKVLYPWKRKLDGRSVLQPAHAYLGSASGGCYRLFRLKMAEASSKRTNALRLATYAALVLLAVVPNGIHAVAAPPLQTTGGALLPNYAGLFYLDAFFVFAGWAISGVIRTRT